MAQNSAAAPTGAPARGGTGATGYHDRQLLAQPVQPPQLPSGRCTMAAEPGGEVNPMRFSKPDASRATACVVTLAHASSCSWLQGDQGPFGVICHICQTPLLDAANSSSRPS